MIHGIVWTILLSCVKIVLAKQCLPQDPKLVFYYHGNIPSRAWECTLTNISNCPYWCKSPPHLILDVTTP